MNRLICPEHRDHYIYRQAAPATEPLRPSLAEIVTGLLLLLTYVGFAYAVWSLS